jgi:hypothetical protein
MNCCDYECNEGHNCPVRSAQVTKVKQRYPKHPQPIPSPMWREYLRATARFVLLGLLGWLIFGLILAALVIK